MWPSSLNLQWSIFFIGALTQWNSWDTPEDVSVLGFGPILHCCSVSPPSSVLLWAGQCVWECSVFSFDGLKNLPFIRWTMWILDTCLLSPICTINRPFWIYGPSTWRFKPTSSGNWPLFRKVLQLYTLRKSCWLSTCFDGFLPSCVLLTKSGIVTDSSIWKGAVFMT